MPEISKDIIFLLQYVVPGLVSAWVFFALTPTIRPSPFERVAQALIFTWFVQLFVEAVKWLLFCVGDLVGSSSFLGQIAQQFITVFVAISLGVFFAYLVKNDSLHARLRCLGVTGSSSSPTVWVSVFKRLTSNYVVLNFVDGRRLQGFPKEWPTEPNNGYFFIINAAWLKEEEEVDLGEAIEGLLIDASDIEFVEFFK